MTRVTVGDGETGEAISLDGQVLALVAPKPRAPGQPVAAVAHLPAGDLSLSGRTAAVRKRPDGRYDLHLRLVNLTRAEREQLELALLTSAEHI